MIWPTLSFGLAEVGLSQESARSLKAWYAFKLRSVLNKPAHISRMTTQELFEQYSIEDPVVKLQRLQDNRGKRLQAQLTLRPDITCAEQVIVRSTQVSAALAQQVATPIPEDDQGEPLLRCAHCSKVFVTEQGLRLRVAKSHPEQVKRYVPSSFNRQVHAEGVEPAKQTSNSGLGFSHTCSQELVPARKLWRTSTAKGPHRSSRHRSAVYEHR